MPQLLSEIPVGLEPVSLWPRSNDEVWVVNHVSDSVSVVSVSRGLVTATLEAGDEPADVLIAGSPARVFVTAARDKQLRVFDPDSQALLSTIPLLGEHPRAMAVSEDGERLFVAFALSGNGTTIWPRTASLRPPLQPAPSNPQLPAAARTSQIFDQSDPNYVNVVAYTLLQHDVAEVDIATASVLRYFDGVGTSNLGLAVRPGSADLFVANSEALNRVRFLENLRGHVVDNRLSIVRTDASAQVRPIDLNPGIDYSLLPNPAARSTALAQPVALAFDPSGDFVWLAAFGSDRIAKVNAEGAVLLRIALGDVAADAADPENKRGPRGLALKPDAQRLYVQNRIANSLTVIDTLSAEVLAELPIGRNDPTPEAVRRGRGYLYDAQLSGNGTLSCASCHIDGATDNLAWDLGDRGGDLLTVFDPLSGTPYAMHPMKGPMVTQTLAGLKGFAPYHWRGDMADLNSFNTNFDILLGGQQLGATAMSTFVQFIESISHMANPLLNLDRSLPNNLNGGDANVGLALFQAEPSPIGGVACSSCHSLPNEPFRAEVRPAEGTTANFARKVPTLRQIYKKTGFNNAAGATSTLGFGQICDGSVAGGTPATGAAPSFNALSFVAFQQAWDSGTAPTVGFTRTVDRDNVGSAALSDEWTTLEVRTLAGDNDLIVRGEIAGKMLALQYDAEAGRYRSTSTLTETWTRADLVVAAEQGAVFSLIGVPPGNARPMLGDDSLFANGFE